MVEGLASRGDDVMERMGEISERSSLQGSYLRTVMATRLQSQGEEPSERDDSRQES